VRTYPYRPTWAVPPGATLRETMEAQGLTPDDLARRTGLGLVTVHALLAGDLPVTPDVAQDLERELGVPARPWLRLEDLYRRRTRRAS